MTSQYDNRSGLGGRDAGPQATPIATGKRTLTQGLLPSPGGDTDSEPAQGGLSFLAGSAPSPGASGVDPFFFAPAGGVGPSADASVAAGRIGLGDVSAVRIHTGAHAQALAATHDAHAVTFGQDIHFASGAYAPESSAGARLLGHELAHTAQQRGAAPVLAAKARTTTPGESSEVEADVAGDSFVAALGGREVTPLRVTSTPATIARFYGSAPQAPVATQRPPAPTRPPVRGQSPIGNQNYDPLDEDDHEQGKQAAEGARQRDAGRAEQEKPTLTIRPGGEPPGFVTRSKEPGQIVHGPTPANPHNVVVPFLPHQFHVLPAILHDVPLITKPEELLTLWTLYLLDEPQPAPWTGRAPGLKLHEDPLTLPPDGGCDDGPNTSWVQPFDKMRLPSGAAATQILWRLVRMHGPHDDPGGRVRRGVLVEACTARARDVDALQQLIPPDAGKGVQIKQGERDAQRRRPIPTLVLPLSKAPHLGIYQKLVSGRLLVHEADYDRGNTKQDRKWDAAMRLGGTHGINDAIWRDGKQVLDILGRKYKEPYKGVYRPDWSRSKEKVEMQVDHIVELQLVTRADRGWADSIDNYELLEESANKSSGSILMAMIKKERARLFQETGDRSYLDGPLTFESVVLGGGGLLGERWSPEEIRGGEHLTALRVMNAVEAFGDKVLW